MFWAYLHTSGTVQLKRYFGTEDLQEAAESPFVEKIVPPFEAEDVHQAHLLAKAYLEKTV